MAHSVFLVDTVARVVASLNKPDRRAYDAAISGLKGEGCKAAGYRLAAADGGDFSMCCRHLANDWRMHTLFAKGNSVIVISLARHDKDHNPHQVLTDVFPGLSPVGRRKRAKPPCCADPESPPVMPATLNEQLALATAVIAAPLPRTVERHPSSTPVQRVAASRHSVAVAVHDEIKYVPEYLTMAQIHELDELFALPAGPEDIIHLDE